jgi:hypothetical protein
MLEIDRFNGVLHSIDNKKAFFTLVSRVDGRV